MNTAMAMAIAMAIAVVLLQDYSEYIREIVERHEHHEAGGSRQRLLYA
jgi:hypothetical protein